MGEARRKREADWSGDARPRDEGCPACRSKRVCVLPEEDFEQFNVTLDLHVCVDCRAVWEPFPPVYVRDPVCAEPCDNCAFRPGSPEQEDPERWKALIASLSKAGPDGQGHGWFYCHKGVPIDMTKGPGNFLFPQKSVLMDGKPLTLADGSVAMTEDTSKMRTCSGFLNMIWTRRRRHAH